jgi:hypothetical protein
VFGVLSIFLALSAAVNPNTEVNKEREEMLYTLFYNSVHYADTQVHNSFMKYHLTKDAAIIASLVNSWK